jgi:hypothetical protein
MPEWHHASDIATAVLTRLYDLAVGIFQMLSHSVEFFFDKLHPHPNVVAAAIYLMIVLFVGLILIVLPEESHISRVKRHNWNTTAAYHVWIFSLAIFLINGVLHAVQQLDIHFLATTPLERFEIPVISHLSANTLLAVSVNALLWLLVCVFYVLDGNNWEIGELEPKQRIGATVNYFGHVGLAFGLEDYIAGHWERFESKYLVGEFLKWSHTWSGQSILIAIAVVIPAILVAMRYRKPVGDVAATPRAIGVALVSATVLMIAGALAIFFLSGGNSKAALSGSVISQTN